ncbi:hypothetical protein ORIO_02170 [Cereibacter azotoformans]|uniref:hypothetical protein n=1 Tax=Cereibacter azotoformans TaxID=43057 RepID=UPI0002E2279F|nr:hypothetical protein [Cereibacter azotoformans]ULB08742.1 hypothetical protein ORIO_02170 [Cereibacter azotoformans]
MALDEFQQIAHARANMMLRGHRDLICLAGPRFFERCFPDGQVVPIEERRKSWEEAIGMPIAIRDDMEGFVVVPVV